MAPVARSYMGHLMASCPNEIVAIDFTVLEPSQTGQENVLVMTDVFSKFTVAVPTRISWPEPWLGSWWKSVFFNMGCLGAFIPTRAVILSLT